MRIEKMSTQNEEKSIAKIDLKKGCSRLETFLKLAKQRPNCACVICNIYFYPRSVTEFKCDKYNLDLTNIHPVAVNSTDYICKTCHNCLKKSCIPVQAVCKKLHIFLPPDELKNLEKVLISRPILFQKVAIMPKGQFSKMKGAICNIPIETMDIANTLPQGAGSSGLLMVKLKRKSNFRGHVYFQVVSPESIYATLSYLKENNVFYNNINIDMASLTISLTNLLDEELTDSESRGDALEGNDNPLYRYQCNSQERVLIPDIPIPEEICIAPGEGKISNSLLTDESSEVLAFLYLFPTGKVGYNVQRINKLSPIKYFNQRHLNH